MISAYHLGELPAVLIIDPITGELRCPDNAAWCPDNAAWCSKFLHGAALQVASACAKYGWIHLVDHCRSAFTSFNAGSQLLHRTGFVPPETLIEELVPFMDAGPHDPNASKLAQQVGGMSELFQLGSGDASKLLWRGSCRPCIPRPRPGRRLRCLQLQTKQLRLTRSPKPTRRLRRRWRASARRRGRRLCRGLRMRNLLWHLP